MTTRTVATISMCGGTLTAFVRHEYLPYYTPASQMLDEHDGHRFWLVFEREGEPTEIDTPEQLLATLNAQGCDVQAEVVPVLARFVELLAMLAGWGRAITDSELHDYLLFRRGVPLGEHLPRLERQQLRFLVGDFSAGSERARLSKVEVDLARGTVCRQPLAV